MRRWRRASAVVMVPLVMGCYAYADVDRAAVAPGTTVRVVLEREEALRQVEALGGLRERVEGQVTEQTDGSSLAMTVRETATPTERGRLNAFVVVPWSGVTEVEVKRFSLSRTALVVGGGAVVAVAVLSVLEGSSQGGPGDGGGPENSLRIPLLRLRW